jgi:hypothetical protein
MADPKALFPADVAARCDGFIAHVDAYLKYDTLMHPPHQVGTLEGVDLGIVGATPGDYEVRRTRQALWLRENGPALAAALAWYEKTSTKAEEASARVLEIVRDVEDPDNGPSAVRATWKDAKVTLQHVANQLRSREPMAGDSTPTRTTNVEIMADVLRQRIPQSFVEIADTARILYTFYPQDAAEYRRAKSGLEFVRDAVWRANPEQATNAFPEKGTMLYDALYTYKWRSDHCCELAVTTNNLGLATATLLPGLWPSLRLVGSGGRWHEAEEFNWDAAIGELRQIEAAALSAAMAGPAPDQRTGNATPSPAAKPSDYASCETLDEWEPRIRRQIEELERFENDPIGPQGSGTRIIGNAFLGDGRRLLPGWAELYLEHRPDDFTMVRALLAFMRLVLERVVELREKADERKAAEQKAVEDKATNDKLLGDDVNDAPSTPPAVKPDQDERPGEETNLVLDESRMEVQRWGDLAIGIDENGRYLAVSLCLERAQVFPKEKAVTLDLPGDQWKSLLDLFAESPNGNTAEKLDVMTAFKYLTPGKYKRADLPEMAGDSKTMEELESARDRLTRAMADLARKLRRQVKVPESAGSSRVLSVAAGRQVTAAFTVRYLIRDEKGKLCFGKRPS